MKITIDVAGPEVGKWLANRPSAKHGAIAVDGLMIISAQAPVLVQLDGPGAGVPHVAPESSLTLVVLGAFAEGLDLSSTVTLGTEVVTKANRLLGGLLARADHYRVEVEA